MLKERIHLHEILTNKLEQAAEMKTNLFGE